MRFLVALVGLVVSCAPAMAQFGNRPGLPEPYWCTFRQERNCSITRASSRVIASQNDWEMYWRQLTGRHAADVVAAPGGIDWSWEQLVVVNAGLQPSGAYVYVEDITRSDAFYWVVSVVTVKPQERQSDNRRRRGDNGNGNNNKGNPMCSPYVVVRMSKIGGVPRFAYRTDQPRLCWGRPGDDRYDNGFGNRPGFGRPGQPGQGNQPRRSTYGDAGYDGTFYWGPFGWRHPIQNPPKSNDDSRDRRNRDGASTRTDR